MKELKSLYNGIMNDSSIRLSTTAWISICVRLERRYKKIPYTDEQFRYELVLNALRVAKGSLYKDIERFAKELSDIETKKPISNRPTQRSPFEIGF